MSTFLFKTEPSEYSYDDLARDKTTPWTGVSNAAALKALRSARKGNDAFIYHTGDERAIVGLARIVSNPYEDPKRPGRAADGHPKFPIVDLRAVKRAATPLTLASIKSDERFAAFALVRQSRLSIMEVPPEIEKVIREATGL